MPANINIFKRYANNTIFIETGSYAGDGIKDAIFAGFKEIHSIELAEKYYYYCKEYFKHINWVNLYLGDSTQQLPEILNRIDSPVTFWLDAHYSGGDTTFANSLTPLMRELDIIGGHKIKTHTILIDDLREWKVDYPAIGFGLDNIKNKILEINSNYIFDFMDGYALGDILVAEMPDKRPINIIVFSKDRAMQLDLFIRSFQTFVKQQQLYDIKVLYTYSNGKFGLGYDKLIEKNYQNVHFKKENNFKEDVIGLINRENPYSVFFVDDDVFKEHFDFYDKQMDIFSWNEGILCRSLRLHKNLNYCYTLQLPIKPPAFGSDNVFTWRGLKGDYGYPMSLDGHIFRTKDILHHIDGLDYKNPNMLEGLMARHPGNKSLMICYDKSVIINNPINRVQNISKNIHGNISAEELNNRFINGEVIKLDNFIGFNNTSCHQEIIPEFS